MKRGEFSMTIGAASGETSRLLDAVEQFLADHEAPPRTAAGLMVAIDDIVANIVAYAYPPPRREPAFAQVDLIIEDGRVTVEIVDAGLAFDPLAAPPPDTSLAMEDREIGGLGILLVRREMDEVRYARRDGRNHLTLIKALG